MTGELRTAAFGVEATAALGELVADAKAGDPFAPVMVVVPAAAAGVSLRRAIARAAGGLVNVRFVSMPALAERLAAARLAAAGRPPLPGVLGRGHLRAVLAGAGGLLGDADVGAGASTERALEASFAELAALEPSARRVLAQRGGTVSATVGLFERWRGATAGYALDADAVREATAAVVAGELPPALGPFVVHLPRRLDAAAVDLLGALADRVDVHVLLGRTGHADADAPTQLIAARLAARFGGPVPDFPEAPSGAIRPTRVVWAPDPTEEVEVAVREVANALSSGVPAERIAVVARVRDPYAAALHERLAALGVPHQAPRVTTLAQSPPGRVLTALLDVAAGDYRRTDVMALLRAAPLIDPATGQPPPVPWWDRLSREAGVLRGLDQWRERLARAAEARLGYLVPAGVDPDLDRRIAGLAHLSAFVEGLAARLRPPGEATWVTWAAWAGSLLDALLDPGVVDEEADALARVRAAIDGLDVLDGVDQPPTAERFRRILTAELDRPDGRHGAFGQGVLAGRLVDVVGADLDLVVVLGAAEGRLPPRRRDDSLLPDRDRAASGAGIASRGLTRGEEQRDLLAALAAGRERVLVGPRSDPREQRERQPAPWFLDACTERAGRLVGGADLAGLRGSEWFVDIASFEAWPAGLLPPATPDDLDLGDLLADHRAGGALAAGVVASGDPALARGLSAAASRRRGEFDAWSGHVGPRGDLLVDLDRPRSPTGLEQYAACPFRFFLSSVLRIGASHDPTEVDLISALDEGSLVHEVLERFIADAGSKPPDEPWSAGERDRMLTLVDEVTGRYQAEGRTGRELLWGVRVKQLRHQLLRVLDTDERLRAAAGVSPAAVELSFGFDESGPVTLELDDGRTVAFKGTADRVDVSPDGRRLVVYDYKSGKHEPFLGVQYDGEGGGDLTARGTKLQLPIYALAARRRWPEAEEVEARYWFVGARSNGRTLGGPFDAAAEVRFGDVVGTVIDGIEAGRFPANPGREQYRFGAWTHDNCGWCDFDRVCPTTRGETWVQLRRSPELASYVALAEEQHADGDADG